MKTAFLVPDSPNLSVEELSAATGEPAERLQELRLLGLIRPDAGERFAPEDIERVRLVQFLERRQIPLETIARGERDEAVLTSVVDFLYPRGIGRRYSFAQAVDIVGLDSDDLGRLRDSCAPSDEPMNEHDVRMLEESKVALDAGFPEDAFVQLVRVYVAALERVAEAEVRLFHFYVHEGLKATGLAGHDLRESTKAVRDHMLPVVGPMIRYFHHRAWPNPFAKTWCYISRRIRRHLAREIRQPSSGWRSYSSTSRVTPRSRKSWETLWPPGSSSGYPSSYAKRPYGSTAESSIGSATPSC